MFQAKNLLKLITGLRSLFCFGSIQYDKTEFSRSAIRSLQLGDFGLENETLTRRLNHDMVHFGLNSFMIRLFSSWQMPQWLTNMGPNAYEYQCNKGVNLAMKQSRDRKRRRVQYSPECPCTVLHQPSVLKTEEG